MYLDPNRYLRAQKLDELYYDRHPGLMRLYASVEARLREGAIDVLLVDNCPPYHPDWLRGLPVFKVLRTSDGPLTAYDRDFAYVHAYDLVLYHSPAYSRDMGMDEKLHYVGAKRTAFWPLGLFEAVYSPDTSEEILFGLERDLDVVFVGGLHVNKMPLIAKVKKAFGSRCRIHGLASTKKNTYFNLMYGFPGWVRPIPQSRYVPLYQRAKIGFNVHNRGKYTVGGYRLYELPANGVLQISDGDEFLERFFRVGATRLLATPAQTSSSTRFATTSPMRRNGFESLVTPTGASSATTESNTSCTGWSTSSSMRMSEVSVALSAMSEPRQPRRWISSSYQVAGRNLQPQPNQVRRCAKFG